METNDGIYADPQQKKDSGDTDSKRMEALSSGHRSALQKRDRPICAAKSEWISFHQDKIKRERERQGSFSLLDGRFPLLGAMFPVEYLDEGKPFYYEGTFFLCKGRKKNFVHRHSSFTERLQGEELSRRVAFYAQKNGSIPNSNSNQWSKGKDGVPAPERTSLNFSWRLMMAPEHAVNYVVVHELCHILHHDHSREFWQEVERFFPDWKECRRHLTKHHKKPYFYDTGINNQGEEQIRVLPLIF